MTHGDVVMVDEGGPWTIACVVSCGPKTFDVVVEGGSTLRFKHGSRGVRPATIADFNGDVEYMKSASARLRKHAADAREERRIGARIKRGQIWPSH